MKKLVALAVFLILVTLGLGWCFNDLLFQSNALEAANKNLSARVLAATSEIRKLADRLAIYEAPYDDLLVLKEEPQPDKLCTMCCCRKSLQVCHVACIRYKGGHNAMCSSLCSMKARGIPMPLEHGTE